MALPSSGLPRAAVAHPADPAAPPMVWVRDLVFRWARDQPPCLQIPRFEVARGEHLFLHGPSGSGKSSLLGLLGAVSRPQQGELWVAGQDLARLGASARDRFRVDHVGFIFQQFNLVPYLSALDNVLLPCQFSRARAERARQDDGSLAAAGARLLAAMGLDVVLQRRSVLALSVGQQQRVAAARALIGRPPLVIADEPTSALDTDAQQAFLDLLLQECGRSQATLLFVSHDHRLAPRFDRQLALASVNQAGQGSPGTADTAQGATP